MPTLIEKIQITLDVRGGRFSDVIVSLHARVRDFIYVHTIHIYIRTSFRLIEQGADFSEVVVSTYVHACLRLRTTCSPAVSAGRATRFLASPCKNGGIASNYPRTYTVVA